MNIFALNTTYPQKRGLADCQGHIHFVMNVLALDTTYPPNGGLADCQEHIHHVLDFLPSTQPILLMEDWLIVQR